MPVELTYRDEFALLTLNRPEALNALSFQIVKDISAAFDEVETSGKRALLITGAGEKAFCAGADINELSGRGMQEEIKATQYGQATFARLDTMAMPSVALINGYAFGGGLELAMACTFRLATANARMGLPEIKLGLVPGYGGTQRLPRLVGESRALELVMTGRAVKTIEAERIGLVNRVIESDTDVIEAGMVFAREFTCHSLLALQLARSAVSRALDVPINEGLKIETDLSTLSFQTRDSKEGTTAFLEKRPADFQDR